MDGVPARRYFTLTASRRTGKIHSLRYFDNSYCGLQLIHILYLYLYIGIDQIHYCYYPVLLLLLLLLLLFSYSYKIF